MKLSLKSLTAVTLIALSTITAQAITSQDIQKLYTATFDRVPDRAGVDYWLNSGLAIEEVAQSFFDQKETQTKYPDGLPQEEFVKSVYQNLFTREPDGDGLNYWIKELNSGNITPSNFILAVINGAKGEDVDILEKKSQVSENFLNGEITEEEAKVALKAIGDESRGEDTQIQIELNNFDELFEKDEFAGYLGKDALRVQVLNGEMTAVQAEELATSSIKYQAFLKNQKEDITDIHHLYKLKLI